MGQWGGVKGASKKLFSNLLILSLIVQASIGLFAFPNQAKAAGTIYYVDNTITDTNVGSATPDCTNYDPAAFTCSGGSASAYKMIADVNLKAFSAGDSVLFRQGQTWREQLTVPSSGTNGNPITFGEYGTGSKPIISGADTVSSWTQTAVAPSGGTFSSGLENETDAFTTEFGGKSVAGSNTVLTTTAAGTVYSGAKAGKITFDGSNYSAYAYKAFSTKTDVYARFYIKLDSNFAMAGTYKTLGVLSLYFTDWGASSGDIAIQSTDSATTFQWYVAVTNSGGTGTTIYNAGTITRGQWYEVDVHEKQSATVGGMQVWINNVSVASNFTINTDGGGRSINQIRVGGGNLDWAADSPTAGSKIYFDDVKVDTSYIGPSSGSPSTNVYYATLTTAPRAVFSGGVPLTSAASLAAMTQGSWYFDSSANRLYVWTADSTSPTGHTIEASQRDYVLYIGGKNYITVDGLQIEKNNGAFQGGIVIDGQPASSVGVTVKNSTVAYTNGGIYLFSANDVTINNNTIYGNTAFSSAGITPNQGTGAGSSNLTITNNIIHDVAVGISNPIGNTSNISSGLISGNTIYNLTNNGINLNNSSNLTIEKNIVHDGGTAISDTTGIHFTNTPNSTVRYNEVYNWADPTNIGGNGIQADTNSDNAVIYGNVTYNNAGSGISVIDATNALIYNNTSYGNSQTVNSGEIMLASPVLGRTTAIVKNNIAYVTASGGYAIQIDVTTAANALTITNNDLYKSSGNWYYNGSAGNNLATWNALSYVGTDLNSDPKFTTNGSDFSLLSTSPAIDTGVSLGSTYKLGLNPNSVWPNAVNTLDQTLNGAGWDMGAYVYTQSTAPTVSISAPSAGTVSGTITITANPSASSPASISSVQFTLDGSNLNSAVTVAPYSITWNSVSVSNGSHTLSAVATDNYSNTTTATPVTVTVYNAVSGGGPLVTYIPPTTSTTVLTPTIPITMVIPTIPAQTICPTGHLFSTSTGLPCTSYLNNATNPLTISPQTTYDFGTVTLRFWSKGEAVRQLQMFLNQDLKLNLKIDGILGLKTMALVKQWQKAHGLVADGVVGAKTKKLMQGTQMIYLN